MKRNADIKEIVRGVMFGTANRRSPDWGDVLSRAHTQTLAQPANSSRSSKKRSEIAKHTLSRKTVLGLAAAVAASIASAAAVGADQGWWFTSIDRAPKAASSIETVARGSWDGKAWSIAAFQSDTGELCYAITPGTTTLASEGQATMTCSPVSDIQTGRSIAYVVADAKPNFPAFAIGAVANDTGKLSIDIGEPTMVDARIINAPAGLGLEVKFFATQLPCGAQPTEMRASSNQGDIIATAEIPAALRNPASAGSACT